MPGGKKSQAKENAAAKAAEEARKAELPTPPGTPGMPPPPPDGDDTIIGIDLGTTYSCVSVHNKVTGKVDVLSNAAGERTMPSWVSFTEAGRLVGKTAKQAAANNAKNTVYDVKRVLGRPFNDEVVENEAKAFPFKLCDDGQGRLEIEVEWRGETKRLAPEEISAMVLGELKAVAEKALGKRVTKAVITVPAHFNDQQRQATKDAGRIAGLDVKRIINEPTAAALAYGLHDSSAVADGRANVVIFDLGGGTFDVSVLSMEGGVFAVGATGGDTHLGGEDFDNRIFTWAVEQVEAEHGKARVNELRKQPRALSRLKRACEDAKRALSSATEVDLEVEGLLKEPVVDLKAKLTREVFEKINEDLFERCLTTVEQVLADASVEKSAVSDIVLVGGSTRVPALQNRLSAHFDGRLELCKSIHPDEAVAVGAAVQGRILASGGMGGGADLAPGEQDCSDLLLLDCTPLSLGIELEGRQMSTLIKRNTPIPCRKTRTYTTVDDWQTEIDVVVYEGERPCIDSNNRLGSFQITGVQRARKGEPQVEVCFAVDANGILQVTAQDTVTGAKAEATIRAERGRLTDEQIDRMVADAEQYRSQDAELAKKYDARNELEKEVYAACDAARARGDEDGAAELDEIKDWLEYDAEHAPLAEFEKRMSIVRNKSA